jgi:Zn-dependent peptidase ImmA (M78 family)
MSLKRGFKAEANRISLALRKTLGLAPHAPMDVKALATHLKVRVVTLTSFEEEYPDVVRQLTKIDGGAFSAATLLFDDGRRITVHNDTHHPHRQGSNLVHEFSHVILKHPFTLPIDASGCRMLDKDIEDEASWLGSVILIPNEAALHKARVAMDTKTACDTYGVSEPLLRMRINASGARIRLNRSYH